MKAATYIRMSKEEQESSPEQRRTEVAKLAAREGYEIVAEFCAVKSQLN